MEKKKEISILDTMPEVEEAFAGLKKAVAPKKTLLDGTVDKEIHDLVFGKKKGEQK